MVFLLDRQQKVGFKDSYPFALMYRHGSRQHATEVTLTQSLPHRILELELFDGTGAFGKTQEPIARFDTEDAVLASDDLASESGAAQITRDRPRPTELQQQRQPRLHERHLEPTSMLEDAMDRLR